MRTLCMMVGVLLAFHGAVLAGQNASRELVLEPVLVTAEKTESDLQQVPQSVTAFTAERIEDAGIASFRDFARRTPNLQVANWGIRGNSYVFIRGVGAVNNEPAVSFSVDDVAVGDSRVFDSGLYDIERIEVLRGPQGTLYGRNSLAGAINIVTRKPENTGGARLEQTLGDYNSLRTIGSLRAPLVADHLFLGLAGTRESRDGYTQNNYLDRDVDTRENLNGRMHLRWLPTDSLDLIWSLDGETLRDGAFPLGPLSKVRSDPYHVDYDFEGAHHRDTAGTSLRAVWDAPWFRLTSISAVRGYEDMAENDQDFTPAALFTAHEDISDRQYSQELRLGSSGEEALSWLAGLYAFRSVKDHSLTLSLAPGVMAPVPLDRDTDSDLRTRGWAVFGQAGWKFLDMFEVTGGLRHERERRSIDHRMRLSSGGMPLEESGLERSASGGAWLPKAQFIVHWSPDMMTYVSAARGYRGAGFNPGALDRSDLGFEAEYSWTYELGAKTSWWNDRLILNAAAFVIDLRDQQVVQLLPTADTIIRNAGRSRSVGFEVESELLLAPGLTIEGGLGCIRAEFTRYADDVAGLDYSGNSAPLAPDYSYHAAVQYRRTLAENMRLFGRETPLTFFSRAEIQGVGPFYWDTANELRESAYETVDLRLGLETEHLTLTAWAANLFDRRYASVAFAFPGSEPIGEAAPPRTVGLTLTASF